MTYLVEHIIYIYAAAKSHQSCLTLCDPIDCTQQAPLSPGFSRQESWSGLLFPSLGIFLTQGLNPQKQTHYFANKGSSSQGYGFSCGHVWM